MTLQPELTAVQPLPGRSQSKSAGRQTFEKWDSLSREVQGKASLEEWAFINHFICTCTSKVPLKNVGCKVRVRKPQINEKTVV